MLRKRQNIDTIDHNMPDSIFLSAVSFEERCLNSSRLLSDNYITDDFILIRYRGADKGYKRNTHQNVLVKNLGSHLARKERGTVIYCDIDDPVDGLVKLKEVLKNRDLSEGRITIDITTFTKQYLLVLLNSIRQDYSSASIRILYTPGYYKVSPSHPEKTALSWGVKEIKPVPGFLGNCLPWQDDILVLFLGYEGERAFQIMQKLEPQKTLAVLPNPPSYPYADRPTYSLNRKILSRSKDEVERYEANPLDPENTRDLLLKLSKNYEDEKRCNLIISPLCTKIQTLGILLFFWTKKDTNAQVIYASPFWYNEKKYTSGFPNYVLEYII